MRVVRVSVGVLLGLIGLLLAIGGGVAAFFVIGPDDTVQSDEQHLVSKGLAIASTPELLDRNGPILHVEARSASGKPVFVGVGRDFDVASYLKGAAHTSLVQLTYPIALSTQEQKGATDALAAPAALDWWVTKAAGAGSQTIRWPIADGPYDVVIMPADGKTVPDVQVRLGIEIPNAFLIALAVFVGGLLILALGIVLVVVRRRPATPAPVVAQPPAPAPFGTTYRVVAGAAVLGLLTGCSVVPARDTVTTITRPAITNEAGAAVVKRYNEVSTAAGRARNEVQIGQVEGGDLLRQTQANYAIGRHLKRPLPKPSTYGKPKFAVPEYGGYPMRFLTTEGSAVGLWQREEAGRPWMRTFAASLQKSAKLPDLTGLRPAVDADSKNFATAPQGAPAALSEYLTALGRTAKGASFEVLPKFGTEFKERIKLQNHWKKHPDTIESITWTYRALTPATVFVTKGGDAVVLATMTEEYLAVVGTTPGITVRWSSGEALPFSRSTTEYSSALKMTTLHDVVLVVPPKGKGKIRIAAYESQLVDAGGY